MNDEKKTETAATPPPLTAGIVDSTRPGSLLTALLKSPAAVAAEIAGDRVAGKMGLFLLMCAVLSHAVFGFAMGLFNGWETGLVAAVKAPLIALASLVLCFPSLYVFSSVGGAALSLRQTFLLGSACLAMVGLLLIGLAPVVWLFAVSTASLVFMVLLVLFVWFVSMTFAVRFSGKLKTAYPRTGGISFWFVIFALVALQMTTCLRPVLTPSAAGSGWFAGQKQFFLAHFASCFNETATPNRTPQMRR